MTKTQRNWLRVPGLFIRVPLLCLCYHVIQPITDKFVKGSEWVCENWFKGLDL